MESGIELVPTTPSSYDSPPASPVEGIQIYPVQDHGGYYEQGQNWSEANGSQVQYYQPPTVNQSYYFYADLLHKPRGSGGQYIPLTNSEHVRVSKGGKGLRVILRSTVLFDWNHITVNLCEGHGVDFENLNYVPVEGHSFTIETFQNLDTEVIDGIPLYVFQMDVKIFHQSKNYPILFQISCADQNNLIHTCSTVSVFSHDSGNRKRKSPDSPIPEVGITKKPRVEKHRESIETELFPHSIEVNGNVKAMGFFRFSDIRYKTDIEDIRDAFQIIKQIDGKSYIWKEDFDIEGTYNGERVIGLIAQEVRRVLPEVVREDENGYLSVDYADIVPVLIEAFKDHVKHVETWSEKLENEIKELKEQVSTFRPSPFVMDFMGWSHKSKRTVTTYDEKGKKTVTKETVKVLRDKDKDASYCCKGLSSVTTFILALTFFVIILGATVVTIYYVLNTASNSTTAGGTDTIPTDAYENRIVNSDFSLLRNGAPIGWVIFGDTITVISEDENYLDVNCSHSYCGVSQTLTVCFIPLLI
eukprot:TRINITY_DN3600_c0_g1_i1.p1 TRINITY_DN3600_c0_g1~~TRINITY_DN3600_c0_g1_i1.p1  ORF type:complete len:528 (-),score=101.98 TRINITY_DN3600_c0_g1_i1:318-1901(-)